MALSLWLRVIPDYSEHCLGRGNKLLLSGSSFSMNMDQAITTRLDHDLQNLTNVSIII